MSPTSSRPRSFWDDAVVYQLYVRSFADSDGDGVGDLGGVIRRLGHIAGLGADAIWLNPCYPSPQADHGYDIADYLGVNPDYGSLETFDRLVAEAHARGLRILMDLVPNHCSEQHPWFTAALAAGPGSPERARFVFRDGRGDEPPNNWQSVFGGPAWTRVTEPDGTPGQWYLHLFTREQPDFDWRNAEVLAYFDDVLRFWFDRGVDGFRIDVCHGLIKDAALRDWDPADGGYNAYSWNRPEVHEIFRRWRALAAGYGPERDLLLVGEVWVPDPADLDSYLRPDELHQAFSFDLLVQPWEAGALRGAIERATARTEVHGAPAAWTLANHDVHRAVTRYGIVRPEPAPESNDAFAALMRPRGEVDVELGDRRARAALLLVLALPGSVFLYQGEELGLPEVQDLPDEARQDPVFHRTGGLEKGRDGCRVPLPWVADAPAFGFGTGTPWLPQPEWFGRYAVDVQEKDDTSTLQLYRRAVRARRERQLGAPGPVEWLDTGAPGVLAFRRGDLVCVVNTGGTPFTVPDGWGEAVLTSGGSAVVAADAAAWFTPAGS
ncbi:MULTISPECIES: glycoside hydrolase family 13 protein [unclassified Amycolatopsis]|uniref:glycoside hydrolase family 13 protein n=1 Tax=unclassified Amycolatopsis TaxID=2618356 RepID=UPI0028762BF3|nr:MULTISPECIES: glycoside hydrolase family 13 protein [unclassified Amycolatopsis]MDS0140368.1 glycoside hydrolase family 13 protein [Amycolatopsis sp. 505]MDS0149027.1 glycoside hydrolase family 13 protein [Amycolatopsis sp. CM201R]